MTTSPKIIKSENILLRLPWKIFICIETKYDYLGKIVPDV